jgi:hypothetical protein
MNTDDSNYQEWITARHPKLTHHADGSAHASGTGIISGFYRLTGKPKGVHIQSMNLARNDNDGGPLYTCMFWGLDEFTIGRRNSQIVFKEDEIIPGVPGDEPNYGYAIECFYLPRALEKWVNPISGKVIKVHPFFGNLICKRVPAPLNTPGFLILACFKVSHSSKSSHACIIGGAPSCRDKDGYFENIHIARNAQDVILGKSPSRSIDLKFINKIIFSTDSYISGFLEKTLIKNKISNISFKYYPKIIILFRLRLILSKPIRDITQIKKLFKLLKGLLLMENINDYKTLFFYSFWITNPKEKDKKLIENLFKNLSDHTQTPIFGRRKCINNDVIEICSIINLINQMRDFLNKHKLPIKAIVEKTELEDFLKIFNIYIKSNPIVINDIPTAILGSNIKFFVVSGFSDFMMDNPGVLYSNVHFFNSGSASIGAPVQGSVSFFYSL